MLLIVCLSTSLRAQNANGEEILKPSETTFVRFWNMCPRDGKLISLVSRRGENLDPLFDNLRGFDFRFYAPLKAKRYTLRAQDNTGKIIGEVPLDAEKECYYTIVAEPSGSGAKLRVIDDTYKYILGAPNRLTVHQFVPGLNVSAFLGTQKPQQIGAGQSLVFENVKDGDELHIQTTTPQGTPFDARLPISTSKDGNHFSYLILLDRYGEMSLRMQQDGYVYTPPEDQDGKPLPSPSPSASP